MYLTTDFHDRNYANDRIETQVQFRYPWIIAFAVSIGLWVGLWKLVEMLVWG